MNEDQKNTKGEEALREEKILEFWRENKIFEKSLEKESTKGEFVFYEGPPGANGRPHMGHFETRVFKDAIPRYKTMRGYHVRRRSGWDTHGLPVELQAEKELGIKSKNEIEKYGIKEFNEKCKEILWKYVHEWEDLTDRMGFWLDQQNPYVTYHNEYIESVWNIIKQADNQKLLYKDYKVVPWCPRCGTALSSHELAQGYETVKDLSVYTKFRVVLPEHALRRSHSVLEGQDLNVRSEDSSEHVPATYILAWTTTPWTLPGNLALAVGKDIDYVKVKVSEEFYILAKARLSVVENYEIVEEMKGKDLIGLKYEPLYPFLKDNYKGEGLEKAYQVYAADFVTTEDGTGVVHTAVMYGQDDFVLGNKIGLPKYHLVNPEGKFIQGTGFLEGRFVRDEETAVEIIKDLAHRGLLFKKEKYEHTYPFCWRCKTALIYYARDSWYIRMSDPKIKNKLISENKKINWEPAHIRDGRFGEWLAELKDWAISRERYWGTPLPVWVAEDGEKLVIGSLEDLRKYTKRSSNRYMLMRHGHAKSNERNVISSKDDEANPLTAQGIKEVTKSAKKLQKEKIDLIFVSPLARAKQTAEIVRSELGVAPENVVVDERLREIEFGVLEDRPIREYWDFFKDPRERFTKAPEGGENLYDVKARAGQFLRDIENKYQNKKILIVAHEDTLWMMHSAAEGRNEREALVLKDSEEDYFENGEVKPAEFVQMPHNEKFELDLHRPFIDDIVLEKDGKTFRRTKEVMDVWLDSGAMPFAQDHYPFENKKWIDGKGYPADYISEGVDQTRGWFYTLHAVGILMGKGRAFNNVICLGMILDDKGKKMSKSVGNVVSPWEMMDKYGVDTLRLWMYSVNQPGDSKNFDEKTVLELKRQVFGLLYNVLAFYELYCDKNVEKNDRPKSKNVLDVWILAKLDELIELSTKNLENYKLLEPVRAIKEFIGDLSTWYLRRSRERIKSSSAEGYGGTQEGDEAKVTLYYVLKNLAKVMAPFAPFAAEDIWQKLKTAKDEESVHLAGWPQAGKVHPDKLEFMSLTREMVSRGLEARQKGGIPVRQPLSRVEITQKLGQEYAELIKDELNVKEVAFGNEFKLATELTTELRMEGEYRELVRSIQDLRKKQGLTPSDKIILTLGEDARNLVQKFESDLKKAVLATEIKMGENMSVEVFK